jgi:hypothetical protein
MNVVCPLEVGRRRERKIKSILEIQIFSNLILKSKWEKS